MKLIDDPRLWHKCQPFWPVRLIEGGWTVFPVWRRMAAKGRWEYSSREDTHEEWLERQW